MTAARERAVDRPPERSGVVRAWRDVGLLATGVLVLLLSGLVASDAQVPAAERVVFRAVNDPSVLPFALVWPVMQLGNFATVLLATVVAAGLRRGRLALGLLTGGLSAYLLARAVKVLVERPRPDGLLEDVAVRGPHVEGFGFVSGHAAVSAVLVAVLLPWVGRRARVVLVLLAALVGLSRVYVGAHLPLDVLAGAALAVAVGAAVHLALGRPRSARGGGGELGGAGSGVALGGRR